MRHSGPAGERWHQALRYATQRCQVDDLAAGLGRFGEMCREVILDKNTVFASHSIRTVEQHSM